MTTLGEATDALTEFAVRDWLRTVPGVLGRVAGDARRIDLDYSGTGTYLVLYRSGGAPARNLPMDRALITLHCYGSTRHAAALLEGQVVKALRSLTAQTLNATVYCYGAEVLSSGTWLPTEDGRPRYIVTASVATRRVTDS